MPNNIVKSETTEIQLEQTKYMLSTKYMWHDMTQLRFDIFTTFDIFLLLKEFIYLSVGYIMYNKSFNMSSVRLLSFIHSMILSV